MLARFSLARTSAFDESDDARARTGVIGLPRKEQRVLAQVKLTPVAPSTEKEKPTSSAPAVPLPRRTRREKSSGAAPGDCCFRPTGEAMHAAAA